MCDLCGYLGAAIFITLLALGQANPCDGNENDGDALIFFSAGPAQEIPAELRAFLAADDARTGEPFFPGFRSLKGEPLLAPDVDAQFQQLNMLASTLFADDKPSSGFTVTLFTSELQMAPQMAPKVEHILNSEEERSHHKGGFHAKFQQVCGRDRIRYCADKNGPLATLRCMGSHHNDLSEDCKHFMPRHPLLFALACLAVHILILCAICYLAYSAMRCVSRCICGGRTSPEDEDADMKYYVPLAEDDEDEVVITGIPVMFTAEV